MKNIFLFTVLSVVLFSCERKVVTEYRDVPALRASCIYRGDSLYQYMKTYKDTNNALAESYIKKAEDSEKSDVAMSVYFTKGAITLDPKKEYYKKLAALLERTENYSELVEMYYPIVNTSYIRDANNNSSDVFVFGQPDEETYYEYMVAEMKSRGSLYGDIIYSARTYGFDIPKLKEKLFSDKRLKIDASSPETKNMMLLFLSDNELAAYNKLESTFKEMLSSIKDVSPVFEITKENVSSFSYEDFNGRNDYEEMEGPTTSYVYVNYLKEKREEPEGWYKFNFNHVVDISDSVKAVIYAIDSSENACPVEMRHIYHRLVTYNKKAEIISSQIVAMQSGDKLMTMSFNMNKFSVTEWNRSWKSPYDKRDFDNYVTGIRNVKTSSYEIRPDGRIVETGAMAAVQ